MTVSSKTTTPRSKSKAAKARKIFGRFPALENEALVAKFVKQVGLTENGAKTYLSNIRKEAGLQLRPRAA